MGGSTLNSAITEMVQGPIAEMSAAAKLGTDVQVLIRTEKNMIMTTNPSEIDGFNSKILATRQAVATDRRALEEIADAEVKAKIGDFDGAWQNWMPIQDQIRQLAITNTTASNAQAARFACEAIAGRP